MLEGLTPPALARYWFLQGVTLFWILHLAGLACFCFIVYRRLTPLVRAQRDFRFDRPCARLGLVAKYWLGQWKHPRYRFAGAIHISIFAGFLILATRAFSLLILGVSPSFVPPGGPVYGVLKDYAATLVFVAVTVAAVRRGIFTPARYRVPERFGRDRTADAIFLLALIGVLMLADAVFEGSEAAAKTEQIASTGSLSWILANTLTGVGWPVLQSLYLGAFMTHELAFFFLLCYRPFGIQFHVETSLFSVFFAKLDREIVKPVRWGVPDDQLDQVKSLGVKTFEDFTWKHMLDFYSCADCGRCSDQCPSNAVGRPLSPRLLTIKARDYAFRHYPMFRAAKNGTPLVGAIYSEDEVWSCTTCGACEAECPMLVEYIDKIVDLRRGLVDEGRVPQSLQKPLKALETRGNPYGKMEKKRGDWAKDLVGQGFGPAAGLPPGATDADTLYFVDSITSYDDRIQSIAGATAKILTRAGVNFGILGAKEKDSGHEVRRFGEETLFMALRDHNAEAIRESGAKRIVTADPHAFNALKHDYKDVPPVEHISQVVAREVKAGHLRLKPVENPDDVYAYHDPCYLGRHNDVYDDPREVLDAIPGLKRIEMKRSRDRSFCCGGGGLALFYEPKEDQRMGVKRVQMAADAGANVIVTACPFCMVNIEDAIKVAGLEGKLRAIDLTELVEKSSQPSAISSQPNPGKLIADS